MAEAVRGKLQLHWKMLIGFLAGLVLGLVALLYLAAGIAVAGLEVNVVVNRRLFPRAGCSG